MSLEPINIVNLIEKNPITKLSKTYNNKLLTKIKETFTESEQQLFISSFYCYLNYNKTDFVVSLDDIWLWLGFSQKVRAKELLEKYFKENSDYKCTLCRSVEHAHFGGGNDKSLLSLQGKQKKEGRGGGNKKQVLLTVKCFKLFCIKADTKKANEIHEYFIKLEEMLQDIILEECNDIKLQLENKDIEHKKKLQLERQDFLLREFGNIGSLVYIIKVKPYDNGEYVVKIGRSDKGILSRFNEHKSNYDEILLLDCFIVQKSKEFEEFLHNHNDIRPNKVTDMKGHEKENELFLIGKNLSYGTIINIIKQNIKNYNYGCSSNDVEKSKLELESLKLIKDIGDNKSFIEIIKNYSEKTDLLLNKINNLEQSNKEILEKLGTLSQKTTTGFNEPLVTLGPRLQQINPETLQLVRVYESVSQLLKEDIKYKRPSLMKAINENTIYHNYRWMIVSRDLNPNIITNIQETKEIRPQNVGFIAQVNKEKTEIINVYLDRKTAANYNGYKSNAALDNPVKNKTLSNGFYYMLYDDCDEILKKNFEKQNNIPILYKNGIGQYDINNKLLREFVCKYDCSKILGIGEKSLRKSLEKNILYNNHYYKYLGLKDKCL